MGRWADHAEESDPAEARKDVGFGVLYGFGNAIRSWIEGFARFCVFGLGPSVRLLDGLGFTFFPSSLASGFWCVIALLKLLFHGKV